LIKLCTRLNYTEIISEDRRLGGTRDFRWTLHRSRLLSVEDSSVAGTSPMPSGYEPMHQIVLPYFGLFAYAVGRRRWLVDTNKILFISPGWDFRDEQPVPGLGHATVLINLAREIVDEVCGSSATTPNRSFPIGAVQSSPRLQLMTQSLRGSLSADEDALRNDELTIQMMRVAMHGTPVRGRPSVRTVDRAKEFLHAHEGNRLSLEQVSSAVGVSPVYLTQEFTRSEGVPLYQYHLSLRLARALTELPHSDDITGLALDLGFSSHSHFTLAFRNAFGMTPSQYRRLAMRPNVIRSPLDAAGQALRAAWA
jgi:AraC family transcriptional regulator